MAVVSFERMLTGIKYGIIAEGIFLIIQIFIMLFVFDSDFVFTSFEYWTKKNLGASLILFVNNFFYVMRRSNYLKIFFGNIFVI